MDRNHVNSLAEHCWCALIDYGSLLDDDAPLLDLYGDPQPQSPDVVMSMDVSFSGITSQLSNSEERGCPRKRGRPDPDGRIGTKACPERIRREKLNDRLRRMSFVKRN